MFLDGILGSFLKPYLQEDYIPGIGLLLTFVLITVLGWMSTKFITGKILRIIDRLLDKIPFVKTIYSVIKDTIHSFFGGEKIIFEGGNYYNSWNRSENDRLYYF